MNVETMVIYALGGWLTVSVVVLTRVAPRQPAARQPTSIEAVDRLLEHSRAAAAALAAIARATSAEPADLVAQARCESTHCRHVLGSVLAEFGPESDVGRSAIAVLASLQAAVDLLELALMRHDARVVTRPWAVVETPVAVIRDAQDRLMAAVWRTVERRAGGGGTPLPISRSQPHPS